MPFVVGELGVLLGVLKGANMNTTADQAIAMIQGNWIPRRFVFTNASLSLSLAAGGVYDAASKGGNAIVSAAQIYTSLNSAVRFIDATIAITNRIFSTQTIYLSLTTGQGSTATADLYVYGDILP